MADVTKRLATDNTLSGINYTLSSTNTGLPGINTKLISIDNDLKSNGPVDVALKAISTAINNLPNATQDAADNANEAAEYARSTIQQILNTVLHFEAIQEDTYATCDDFPIGRITFVSRKSGVPYISDFPLDDAGTLICFGISNFPVQIAISYLDSPRTIKIRSKTFDGWTTWAELCGDSIMNSFLHFEMISRDTYASCDDVPSGRIIFVSHYSGEGLDIPDYPVNGSGTLVCFGDSNLCVQIAISNSDSPRIVKMRSKYFDIWRSWADISHGGETIVTQEVSRDVYNNTYEINCTPHITTDANGWLSSTGDTTDMTGPIMAMLNETGYCHLGPGTFYVSGNIDMPESSLLEGCGNRTVLRLYSNVTSGYIVRLHTFSTIKNVCFSGGSTPDMTNSDIGGRKGVAFIGNADRTENDIVPTHGLRCQIEGCWFIDIDNGFYGHNTGGGVDECVEMSN